MDSQNFQYINLLVLSCIAIPMAFFITAHGFANTRSLVYFVCGSSFLLSDLTLSLPSQNHPPNPPLNTDPLKSKKNLLIALSISALLLILISMACCFRFRTHKIRRTNKHQDPENQIPNTQVPDSQSELVSITSLDGSVKRFKWVEIVKLSKNFSSVIGEGGFSTVYQAYFPDSTQGALKIHTNSERLIRVFKQELEVLLQIRHENIVKLIGFCDEQEEGALVFEYIPGGNLHQKLHDSSKTLPWNQRTLIAFQLASALEYLHDHCNLQIVHADIKSSNVLLDENLNCKLCDFGSAKMGFSAMILPSSATPVMGSPGYVDPHYIRTGLVSKKNDVYGFGVLVLELLTGKEAFCSEKQQLLTTRASPALKDSKRITEMIDSRLDGQFDEEEAMVMASISALCILQQPSLRPSMAEILKIMREKISSAFSTGKFKENGKGDDM